jgi:hypothetical protein
MKIAREILRETDLEENFFSEGDAGCGWVSLKNSGRH